MHKDSLSTAIPSSDLFCGIVHYPTKFQADI